MSTLSARLTSALPAIAGSRGQALQLTFATGFSVLSVLQLVHSWPALAAGTLFYNLNNDARSNPLLELAHTATVGIVFFAYLRTLVRWQESPLSVRQVVSLLVPSSLLAWLALPATSTDILFYIGVGRLVVLHGANPYLHTYEEFDDGFSRYLDWPDATMPYGPLLLPFFSAGGWLSTLTPIGAIYLLKFCSLLLYFASCWVLHRLLKALGRDAGFGLFLFALNPLLLLDQIGNGHNDGLMLLFGLLGLWALARERSAAALYLALLSALSKLPGIVFLALVVSRLLWRRQWAPLARGTAFALLVGALLGWWLFPSQEAALSLTNPTSSAVNSLHRVLFDTVVKLKGWNDESPGFERFYELERALSLSLFAVYFVWRLVAGQHRGSVQGLVREQIYILFAILIAYTAWFLPWYTLWLLPLAALVESRALALVIVAYTASVCVFFAFPSSLLGDTWQVLRILLAHGVPITLLIRAWQHSARERAAGPALLAPVGGPPERSP